MNKVNALVRPLMMFFQFIHDSLIHAGITNLSLAYFLDIFIFTLIIKLILMPLTIKQIKSTVKSTELQPKIKELQAKYKNDPQMMQQKQMELYKELGINPLSGCLLMFIQLPIFMAMYSVIYNYTGFHGVPFLWVSSFDAVDKKFILPILSGVTSYLSMLLIAPKGDDPQVKTQRQMNIFFAGFSVYIGLKFKSALVLYWIISNVIQMLQQYFIINRVKKHEEAKLAK